MVSLAEEFAAALEYIREPGSAGDLRAKKVEQSIDELERYCVQQEICLDRQTLAKLNALAAESWAHHSEVERLPRRYGDPNFEQEGERVGAELDWCLYTELAKAQEGLTASLRAMLGVGRRPYGLLQ